MALMTGVCAVVFVFHTGIAFTTSLATLIACSTVMEFGMGMLDTGRLAMPPLCGRHHFDLFSLAISGLSTPGKLDRNCLVKKVFGWSRNL